MGAPSMGSGSRWYLVVVVVVVVEAEREERYQGTPGDVYTRPSSMYSRSR